MGGKESKTKVGNTNHQYKNQPIDATIIELISFNNSESAEANTTHAAVEKFEIIRMLLNARQYRLLSCINEQAMRKFSQEHNSWTQLALSLICENKFRSALKLYEQHKFDWDGETGLLEEMLVALFQIEQMENLDSAIQSLEHAIHRAKGSAFEARFYFLLALAISFKARNEICYEVRKLLASKCIADFRKAIELDPLDYLASFYCSLELAISRNFDQSKEMCQKSIDLNPDNPSAFMLLILILTALKDLERAVTLVNEALTEFPSHYGLMVIKLKLEANAGLTANALNTSRELMYFWRKTKASVYDPGVCGGSKLSQQIGSEINGKTPSKPLPMVSEIDQNQTTVHKLITPLFTAPLGIPTPSRLSLSVTNTQDITYPPEGFVTGQTAEHHMGTKSESYSAFSSSSKSWMSFNVFRLQADIWTQLADLFIEANRPNDIQICVEEACTIYPNSHQALYLKGRLLLMEAERSQNLDETKSRVLSAKAKSCLLGSLSILANHIPSLMCLSTLYIQEGNQKMAEKILRDIISMDPLNYEGWCSLGKLFAGQGLDEEAIDFFKMADSLDKRTPILPFDSVPRIIRPLNY